MKMNMTSLQVDTAVMGTGSRSGGGLTSPTLITSPAFETTLISYANKILKIKSPTTAVIDPSVAPYVTSILRSSLSDMSSSSSRSKDSSRDRDKEVSVRNIAEYDALMELLMEQCDMESEMAHSALSSIARAIQTGEFQDFGGRSRSLSLGMGFHQNHHGQSSFNSNLIGNGTMSYLGIGNGSLMMSPSGKFRSKSMGAEHDYYGDGDAMRFLGNMLKENDASSSLKTTDENGYERTLVDGTSSHRGRMDPSIISTCTLPDWSVAKRRQDSPEIKDGDCVIEEEPSNFLDDEDAPLEKTPVKHAESEVTNILSGTTMTETPSSDVLLTGGGFSPFLTEEERKVAEGLKNLQTPMFSFTPLKQDQLIPLDLLGMIDDPSTPSSGDMGTRQTMSTQISKLNTLSSISDSIADSGDCVAALQGNHQDPTDVGKHNQDHSFNGTTLEVHSSNETTAPQAKPPLLGAKSKKKVKKKDHELAAALFAKPRSRSISYDEKSPKLKPMAPPPASKIGLSGLKNCSADALLSNSIPALFQKQLDSAIEILMAMNFDICREAAHEAALVSNADVNIAQHVIDGALSAPPVCRHLLKDGCYRSDCQFSHDVDGHTCLFWLRGRCGKGESCRFMHGFSEKLLDGVNVDFRHASESEDKTEATFALPGAQPSSMKPPIVKTGNLVQYNMKNSFSISQRPYSGSGGNLSSYNLQAENQMAESSDNNIDALFPGMVNQNSPPSDVLETSPPANAPQTVSSGSSFSFATIASKGYNKMSSFNKGKETTEYHEINKDSWECSTVRIPQNLWTAAQNRTSGAFHITDPIARFKEVSSTIQRDDVIDLHFQSAKTFPVVLSSFLPSKLKDHGEVWVITGSGHHVSRNSHQKGGGVLESAVITWLSSNDYKFSRGKDKNGFGGAILVYKR